MKKISMLIILGLLAMNVSCDQRGDDIQREENPMREAGDEIEDGAEDVGDKFEDAADEVD